MADVGAGLMILVGVGFCVVSAVGVVRLPDLYTRMHAATKAGTLGTGLVLGAAVVSAADASAGLRALAIVLFLVATSPVAAHAIARAAYLSGQARPKVLVDELDDEGTGAPR